MAKKDMLKQMKKELKKIRDYPRLHFHSFAFVDEIEIVRRRLNIAGVRYRTRKVVRNGKIIGYNVYTE